MKKLLEKIMPIWSAFKVSNIQCSEVFNGVLLLLLLPEGEVLLEELDDGLGISEGLLIDLVDLLKGIGESLLTKLTSVLVIIHDLVVEDGEIEGESKSNWVASVEGLRQSLSCIVT